MVDLPDSFLEWAIPKPSGLSSSKWWRSSRRRPKLENSPSLDRQDSPNFLLSPKKPPMTPWLSLLLFPWPATSKLSKVITAKSARKLKITLNQPTIKPPVSRLMQHKNFFNFGKPMTPRDSNSNKMLVNSSNWFRTRNFIYFSLSLRYLIGKSEDFYKFAVSKFSSEFYFRFSDWSSSS